jgi:hypothetical protein
MNTKALVAVIAFVAAASAMAQFKSEDTQLASVSLASNVSTTGFAFDGAGRSKVRLGTSRDLSLAANQGSGSLTSRAAAPLVTERLSFPEPGNFAMLLAGLGVIAFVAGRRQQS